MKLTIALCIYLVSVTAYSQISFGGRPLFQGGLKTSESQIPIEIMPSFDLSKYDTSRSVNSKTTHFAHPFFVDFTPQNSGIWQTLADGTKVWRLAIQSDGAYSLNLIFDRFNLPDGGQMFIFSNDLSSVIGCFTNQSHLATGVFATLPVAGDRIIVEYSQNASVTSEPDFTISAVNHDFIDILKADKVGNFGDAGSCNVNVTCQIPESDHLRSVVRLIVDGTEYCTGTLINNTQNDGTPYFITAEHCLKDTYTNHSFVYLFNFQVPNCHNFIEGDKTQSMTGGTVVVADANIDALLIHLDQIPPLVYRPYWSGWNLVTNPAPPIHTIHHPLGDTKKYSLSQSTPTQSTFHTFAPNAHWRIATWSMGTTEQGSSGAGLFNDANQLIGTLSGGAATCSSPNNDYFSRFNKAWDYNSDPNQQLKKWLNADNQNLVAINGYDYYESQGIKRVTNRLTGENPVLRDQYITGFWLGHNNRTITAFTEAFDTIKEATLHGLYLMAGKSKEVSLQTINMKIWSNQDFSTGSTPVLDTLIDVSTLKYPSENLIRLKKQLTVQSPVSVTISYNYSATTDSVGFYWLSPSTARVKNTLWIKNNETWTPFNQLHPQGLNSSAYLELLASDITWQSTRPVEPPNDTTDYLEFFPNPVIDKINLKWGKDALQRIEIFNFNGQNAMQREYGYNFGDTTLYLNHLSPGIYIIKFHFNKSTSSHKIVVKG